MMSKAEQVERNLQKLQKNGWAAVPFKDQPPAIRRAIRLARMRPLLKQCFANAQRLVINQSEYEFQYHEGIVKSIVPIEHAWLSLDGEVVDVTLLEKPTILAEYTATPEEIRVRMLRTGCYGPVDPQRLSKLCNEIRFGGASFMTF